MLDTMPSETVPISTDFAELAIRLAIDLCAIAVFAVAIYFRRHTRKDLAMVFAFFNICLFVVITVIQMTEVAAALGFGLFAILSIIRLRSEPFDNREIGYFFGSLVLGLLNGIGTAHVWLTVLLNILVVTAIFLLDHPRVLVSPERRHVTLDVVQTEHGALVRLLGDRLHAEILECHVASIDYVNDSMELDVMFRSTPRGFDPPLVEESVATMAGRR